MVNMILLILLIICSILVIPSKPWDLNEDLPETLQSARRLGKGAHLEL